mgnify:CR=1 FL=1
MTTTQTEKELEKAIELAYNNNAFGISIFKLNNLPESKLIAIKIASLKNKNKKFFFPNQS